MLGYKVYVRSKSAPDNKPSTMFYCRDISFLDDSHYVSMEEDHGGYPDIYVAYAYDLILALLVSVYGSGGHNFGPPDSMWHSLDLDYFKGLHPEELLQINCWDQS